MTNALFVDNDATSLEVFDQLCQDINIKATCIQRPMQVQSMLPSLPPFDVIFIDLEMPNMSGYEVLALLKNQPQFASVPMVACTVYTSEVDHAREAGFDSFIIKPIDIDRFPEQITAILASEQIWEHHDRYR